MQRLCALLSLLLLGTAFGQQPLPSTIRVQGLRSVNHHGAFRAGAFLPDGTLALLFDQDDGLRLLKTDAGASTILAEAHQGAAGDIGVSLTVDGAGNIYIGGTSSSGLLAGTPGAAFPTPTGTAVNSFVARFDAGLNLSFLSFLGAGNTVLTGLAVTGDAVFATGINYSSALPTTPGVVFATPSPGSAGNGFVERFSSNGATLVYATYLTGSGGSTSPAAIAADAGDHAYVVGSTSTPHFPTAAALQPQMRAAEAGFLTELTPTGDGLPFSTFIAGSGLSSLALEPSTGNLLLTGNLSPGQFPVLHVAGPIAETPYQALVRVSGDGQTLLDSTLLLSGDQSAISAGTHGDAWVTGTLTAATVVADGSAAVGDSYLLHLTSADAMDAVFRVGGYPTNGVPYARLSSAPGPPALNADGTAVLVSSTLTAETDPSLAASQTFDLGLTSANSLLPSTPLDLLPSACSAGLPCSGSGGLVTLFGRGSGQTSLLLSTGASSALTVRNAGPAAATGLQLVGTGGVLDTDCPSLLPVDTQCGAWLSGSGPGSVSVTANNAAAQTVTLPANALAAPPTLSISQPGLDFGIVTAAASPVTRTLTVSNLGTATQTFASGPDGVPPSATYTLVESASTCDGPPTAHVLAAGSSCTVTVALSAGSTPNADSVVKANWKIGARDLPVAGFTQAASLSLSAPTIDLGASLGNATARLPGFLYLSNASPFAIAHSPVASPTSAPFAVHDDCPTTLQPNSVCQIGLVYTQTVAPALDVLTLTLDEGLSVLVTGETLADDPAPGPLALSPLAVSPSSVQFGAAVAVAGLSTETQVVQITNTSNADVTLLPSVSGDFLLQNTCPATLPSQATCDVGLQLAPSQPGLREGLLTLSAGTGFDVSRVLISGTGKPLLDLGDHLDLGETPVGEPVVAWFQLHGSMPNLAVAASGPGFGVTILQDGGDGHGTLAAQAFSPSASAACISCWIGVQFFPSTPGTARGTLKLSTAGNGNPYRVELDATALPTQTLLLSPARVRFGGIPIGSTSEPVTLTLANLLPDASSARLLQVSATGDFRVLPSTDPESCASTLAPTGACSLLVAFSPTQVGLRAGTLTVVTDGGTVRATLSGTGTASSTLAISPVTLTFTEAGQQTITLTNIGQTGTMVLTPIVSGPAFTVAGSCATLAPGQSCTVRVAFQPASAYIAGTLRIPISTTDADGELTEEVYAVPLNGTATVARALLTIFPAQADFGPAPTGTLAQIRQFSVWNRTPAPVSLSVASSRNFPLAAPAGCASVAAGASCTFAVLFLPETAGPQSGTLTITAIGPDGASVGQALAYLQGYGVGSGAIAFSDGIDALLPLNFGRVDSGQTTPQTLTLSNRGDAPLTIRRLLTTAPFQAQTNCTAPLEPGYSCVATLTYAPVYQVDATASHAPRTDHGTLLVESDAQTSPDTVYLAGMVAPAVQTATAGLSALPTYTLSASSLTFSGTLPGASSATHTITLTNSGSAPVAILNVLPLPDFTATTDCAVVQPGASCTIRVAFTPAAGSAPSLHVQTLEIVSNAAAALDSISLLGSSFAAPLQVTPVASDFGSVLLGKDASVQLTVTNGSTLPVFLGEIGIAAGDFSLTASTCPLSGQALPAGQSCTLTVTFAPSAIGSRTGTLTVASPDLSAPLAVPLTGVGIAGHLESNHADLDFGTVQLNAAGTLTVHLSNIGTAPLNGVAANLSGTDAALFRLDSSCPGTLAVGSACDLQVSFHPVQTGPRSATLTLASSDPAGPLLIPLTGVGSLPPGFLLTVNGGDSAAATIHSGDTAAFALLVTPQGGFAEPVTLSCTAVTPAPNATCSLANPQVSLAAGTGHGAATLLTLSGFSPASPLSWTALLLAPGLLAVRRRRVRLLLIGMALAVGSSSLSGCGGTVGVERNPYTPPGTYVYKVTASSTAGPPLASSVTLTVVVQ